MNMKVRAEELKNEVNELMNECVKEWCADSLTNEVDMRTFALLQKCFKITKLAENLMVEQAEAFDDINAKLDKLLYKIGESK